MPSAIRFRPLPKACLGAPNYCPSASALEFEAALKFAYGAVDVEMDLAVQVFAQDAVGDLRLEGPGTNSTQRF